MREEECASRFCTARPNQGPAVLQSCCLVGVPVRLRAPFQDLDDRSCGVNRRSWRLALPAVPRGGVPGGVVRQCSPNVNQSQPAAKRTIHWGNVTAAAQDYMLVCIDPHMSLMSTTRELANPSVAGSRPCVEMKHTGRGYPDIFAGGRLASGRLNTILRAE